MSRRISLYGERAFLNDDQASWLYKILTSFEKGTQGRNSKTRPLVGSTRKTSPHSSSEHASEPPQLMKALAGIDNVSWPDEEMPEAFDITKALEPDGGH
jgi:hypothetical protein